MKYGINSKISTSVNPMSNAVLERIHQVLVTQYRVLTNLLRPTLAKMTRGWAF